MSDGDLEALAAHLTDHLTALGTRIRDDADLVEATAFPGDDGGFTPKAIIGPKVPIDELDEQAPIDDQRRASLERGPAAVETLLAHGARALQPADRDAVELMIAIARPALLMRDGSYAGAAPPWSTVLNAFRPDIAEAAASVGRIDDPAMAPIPYAGTGFVAGDGIVIPTATSRATSPNRAKTAAGSSRAARRLGSNDDDPGARPASAPPPIPITEIVLVHPHLDLALLRLDPGHTAPPPLSLASDPPDSPSGRPLAVIGYPARTANANTPVQRSIFGDRYASSACSRAG